MALEEAHLEVRGAEGAEQVALSGERLTLVRASENTISFPSDEAVSTLHALLERSENGWHVRDLGSTNGTFVNGEKLTGDRILEPGDEITLGRSAVVYRAQDRWPQAPGSGDAEPAPTGAGYLDAGDEWRGRVAEELDAPSASPDEPTWSVAPAPAAAAVPSEQPVAHTSALASDETLRPRGRVGRVRGVARSIQIRRAMDEQDILALRVDRYDDTGNRLQPVAVEFHGYTGGQISDGEEVEVTGKWSSGTLRASKIVNVTTSAEIRGVPRAVRIIQWVVVSVVLGFIAFIAILILQEFF
jgi:FHA domain